MDTPPVSVIIPVHNGEHFLAHALESVSAQTYRAHEVIVVDDGSTDASGNIAQARDRVRYHRQENQGTGSARNAGVRLARGEFLAFLDQDDVWLPDKLSFQMNYLKTFPNFDGVFGGMAQFRAGSSAVARRVGKKMDGYSPSALLIKRACFERVGWFATDLQIGEWAEWYLRALERGLVFGMPEQLVALRGVHLANKGLVQQARRHEYVQLLREALARRKQRELDTGEKHVA